MAKKILNTKNYRLFYSNSTENRPLDIKKHKKLHNSMKKYGFLEEFPIIVFRNNMDQLVIKDGQHRLAFAQMLQLPVYYIETTTDIDVAEINETARNWVLEDYARRHASNGVGSYREALEFAELHNLPIGRAFCLLAGTINFSNVSNQLRKGTFKVKDREWADAVARIYIPIIALSPALKRHIRLLEACMAACRVPDFDSKRLLMGAERCREKLIPYSTRDAYLQMLEDIYNFGRSKLVGLRSQALMAMRERSAVKTK